MIQVKINNFTYEVKFEGDGENVHLKEDSNGRIVFGLYHTSCENDEGLCDFMGAYAEDIVREADRILKEYNNVE